MSRLVRAARSLDAIYTDPSGSVRPSNDRDSKLTTRSKPISARASVRARTSLAFVSLVVLAGLAPPTPTEAQGRFRRPYGPAFRLNYDFDDNYGAAGCRDYACGGACYDGHTGHDFGLGIGNEIRAAQDGVVYSTFNGCANYGYVGNPCGGRCGNYVGVRHRDGATTIYCHMQQGTLRVSVGQSVECGQVLGASASSGSSSGPHLHFGYRPAGGASQQAYAGSCGRSSSLWVQQYGYREAPADRCLASCAEGSRRGCGSDVGECVAGAQTCRGGNWSGCEGGTGPRGEDCNDRDDDCDGRVDEGLARGCGSDVGECVSGTQVCRGGAFGACEGEVPPRPERCNTLDDDCDGSPDDDDVCEVEELALQGGLDDDTDVDGDGRADACACSDGRIECHLSSGHGFTRTLAGPDYERAGFDDPSRFSTLRFGDLDGDGRADVCLRERDGVRCWTSDGAGFPITLAGPPLSDDAGFDRAPYFTSVRLADVDGDGRRDLCARDAAGLRCWISTGRGFEEGPFLPELADARGFSAVEHYGTLRTGDLDGDGRDDVCARDADGVLCWRSTGRGFTHVIVGPRWSDAAGFDRLEIWSTLRLADVDGDGRADLCARTPNGFECHPSTGRGFDAPWIGPRLAGGDGWDDKSHYATLRFGDVDGDGALDLCGRGRGGVTCWMFSGRAFDRSIDGPALSDASGWTEPAWFRTIRLADVDADGRADLCARDADGLRCWRSEGRGFPVVALGPAWREGWDVPERFATIRVAGGLNLGEDPGGPVDPTDPDSAGCRCASADAPRTLALSFVFLVAFARRGVRSSSRSRDGS
jgi:murein DD-endopeptidase MepM/ murein hydrolase activator NlpD